MPGFIINNYGGHRNTSSPATQEYYYTYTWEIENIFGDNNDVLVNAKDLTFPTFNVAKEVVKGASLEYKFAKSVNWDDVKITWYDTKGLIDVIKRWRETVWSIDGGLQSAASYKRDSVVTQYLPHAESLSDVGVRYRLYNSWPSIIRYGNVTYTDSDVKVVEVTLTYDFAEEEVPSEDRY